MSWPAITFTQGLSGFVWVWLLHGLWLGTVAASLVALAFRACRHLTHRTRHLILVSAMLAIALGPPVLTMIQRSQPIAEPGGWLVITQPAARPAPAARALAEPQLRGNARSATVDISWSGLLRRSIERWIDRATACVQAARPIALGGWGVGVGVLAIVMGLGLRGLTKIVGRSVPVAPDVQGRADRLASDLGLRRPPVIRTTDRLDEPCVCGFVRIWILLPSQWLRTASHDSLDAVLAHELAHAKRRDHLANLAQRLVESLFFHHPAVHMRSRRA
jgi:beta-lactamase regulating signal transducer with metallopeptidase domain